MLDPKNLSQKNLVQEDFGFENFRSKRILNLDLPRNLPLKFGQNCVTNS